MDSASVVALARERAGLTLRQLAERASTSHSTLAAYEAGRVTPSVSTLDRIIRAAGLALTAGLTGSVDDPGRDEELQSVLELAAQFPARHDSDLRMPPFRSARIAEAPPSLRQVAAGPR